MFAYCGNNPISYIDPTGTKKQLWFQLFEDHDPGYIHRAVQATIIAIENAKAAIYSTEYIMPGIGRADVVCLDTNEMWEIKHGGSTDTAWDAGINNATAQLDRYINKGATLKKGRAGAFSGTFVINMDSRKYLVTYRTPEAGVILYTVAPLQDQQTEPAYAYSYAPHTLYNSQTVQIAATGLLFAVAGRTAGYVYTQLELQYSYAGR